MDVLIKWNNEQTSPSLVETTLHMSASLIQSKMLKQVLYEIDVL